MKLAVRPSTMHEANAFVAQHHRHSKPVRGCKFALAAVLGEDLMGVVVVGRTVARHLHAEDVAEVTRCCVKDGAPKGTGSFLYGAARRAWNAMGGIKLVTYTLDAENGATLRGAGWVPEAKTAVRKPGLGAWTGKDRDRNWNELYGMPKIRWGTP